jgi:hypothetical protein
VAGVADGFGAGVEAARDAIDAGKPRELLERLRAERRAADADAAAAVEAAGTASAGAPA